MLSLECSVRGVARIVLPGVLVLGTVGACAPRASADDGKDPNKLPPSEQFLRGQYFKGHVWKGGVFDPSRISISPFAAPAGAHLTYFGGRVVSNMQVVQVLYGAGAYNAQVAGTSTPNIGTFYQGVLNSLYVDWLTEYNTTTQAGTRTNQTIGRGSFLTRVTITPSAANNGSTIADTSIQAELAAQIQAGHLPAPTHDAAGNNNTYYAVFFPPGKTITQGGSSSCAAGGFCAYHGTIANVTGVGEIYYGIHPDMQAGSGCATGCGATGSVFGNYTQVASHEMVETITDAEVGLATVLGPPLAWYDNTNGEIGDICNGQGGTVVGSDGLTYNIQLEFSNVANNCIATRAVANDFSISASPTSVSVLRGGSGSSTISTATTSGSAQTVSLSAAGAPSGVTISFSPASVSSGGSSTMTATASATATTGTFTVTVTGTASSGSHTATVSLTVTAVAANDFSISASPTSVTIAAGSSGSSTISTATTSGSAQTVSLSVTGAPAGVTATLAPASVTSGQSATLNISTTSSAAAGTSTLTVTGTAASGSHTAAVTLTVTTGGGGTGITNGGFETGNLSGWTAAGASETVVNTGCHTGSFCADLGSASPTNGDSTITQTFTAPAGATGLSFWYKETCPDTVTFDWALVTLKDNTAGTTATLLNKTCRTNAWTNGTGSITAGHGYTLSLTSHDDNFAGDATFTMYDDVALTSAPPPPSDIVNGGFESGSTGWTTAGVTSIATSGCHLGVQCARAGASTATNGDSSFAQTFTVPSGKTQLSAWYKMTCPDTVTFDWATITLRNNTNGGTTTTVLPRTCATNPAFVNVTTPVTAGSNYTLTLTGHDDNFGADPSFTLFDDVVLN